MIWFYPRKNYGAPITRDRVWILMARTDLMTKAARRDFQTYASSMATALEKNCKVDWYLGATIILELVIHEI